MIFPQARILGAMRKVHIFLDGMEMKRDILKRFSPFSFRMDRENIDRRHSSIGGVDEFYQV